MVMGVITNVTCIYVCGVKRFIFHVLQLLAIKSTQHNLYYNSKSTMKHEHKVDWKSYLPWLSFAKWKCMFVDSFPVYMGFFNCGHYWAWVVNKIWSRNPTSFKHQIPIDNLLNHHLTTHWSNIGVRFKKISKSYSQTLREVDDLFQRNLNFW